VTHSKDLVLLRRLGGFTSFLWNLGKFEILKFFRSLRGFDTLECFRGLGQLDTLAFFGRLGRLGRLRTLFHLEFDTLEYFRGLGQFDTLAFFGRLGRLGHLRTLFHLELFWSFRKLENLQGLSTTFERRTRIIQKSGICSGQGKYC